MNMTTYNVKNIAGPDSTTDSTEITMFYGIIHIYCRKQEAGHGDTVF